MNRSLEGIAIACVAECERQQVGIKELACLISGYAYALEADRLPTEGDVLHLAGVIEPSTGGRYRTTPVTFREGGSAASAQSVPGATARLFAYLDASTDPNGFVHAFLRIHPFNDGNGRLAFILFNWLNHSLEAPAALPEFSFI